MGQINLKSAVDIDEWAFCKCDNLESVELGERLETIGNYAFKGCTSLKTHLKLPSIITIGGGAFSNCHRLTDIELSERLETIGRMAFNGCGRLQRVAVPLKRSLFEFSDYRFVKCEHLTVVDLVGGIHRTVASLHMESWRAELIYDINRINRLLSNTPAFEKGGKIRRWMASLIDKMDHYKADHYRHVKEGITLLELALWKAKLGEKEDNCEEGMTKKAEVDAGSSRKERRITCGAEMVIKNVLPFLQLE